MIKLKEHKGAAAVEFALVLIPLILLLFGIIEFSVYLYDKQVVTNASREGARAGSVATGGDRLPYKGITCAATYDEQNPQSIECVVNHYAKAHLVTFGAGNDPQTYVPVYNKSAAFGDDLTVIVSYYYSFLIIPNFIPVILDLYKTDPQSGAEGMKISATTVMRYE